MDVAIGTGQLRVRLSQSGWRVRRAAVSVAGRARTGAVGGTGAAADRRSRHCGVRGGPARVRDPSARISFPASGLHRQPRQPSRVLVAGRYPEHHGTGGNGRRDRVAGCAGHQVRCGAMRGRGDGARDADANRAHGASARSPACSPSVVRFTQRKSLDLYPVSVGRICVRGRCLRCAPGQGRHEA